MSYGNLEERGMNGEEAAWRQDNDQMTTKG
jgi:hypothetical protein